MTLPRTRKARALPGPSSKLPRVSPEEQVKVISLIEAVIAADGVVAEEEREFLRRVIERFRIAEEDRPDRIMPSDPGRATATLRALAPDAQDLWLINGGQSTILQAGLTPSALVLRTETAATAFGVIRRRSTKASAPC